MTCKELLEFLQTMSDDALRETKVYFMHEAICTEIEDIEIAEENYYRDDYWDEIYLESDLSEEEIKEQIESGDLDLWLNKGDVILH